MSSTSSRSGAFAAIRLCGVVRDGCGLRALVTATGQSNAAHMVGQAGPRRGSTSIPGAVLRKDSS